MSRPRPILLSVNPSEAVAVLKELDGIKVKRARSHIFIDKLRLALQTATTPSDTSPEPDSDA